MEFPLERLLSPVRRTHSCDIELNAAIYTSITTVYYFFSYEHYRPYIRKISKNDFGLRMVNALTFIHRPDGLAQKASDASAPAD